MRKARLPGLLHGEGGERRQPGGQSLEHQVQHRAAGAPAQAIRPVAIEDVLADVEIERRKVVGAEVGQRPPDVLEPVGLVSRTHLAIQRPEPVQDKALQGRHVGQFDPLGLAEPFERAQQVADGVPELAITVDRALQDGRTDPRVLGIVDHRYPQAQDLGPALSDDVRRVHGVAERLRHLLAGLGDREPVGQDRLVGRASARAASFQKARLKPAAVLVGAFQIEICGPAGIGAPPWGTILPMRSVLGRAALQHEGVGRAGIEPDVENILNLFVAVGIVVAEEVAGRPREPGVGALGGDEVDDPGIDVGVLQRLAGDLVDEHGQRRTPGALAADQPVGPRLDH